MTRDRYYWATRYPYAIPEHSYVLRTGRAVPIRNEDDIPALENRHPVIACGSNRSPERLLRKFEGDPEPLPAIRVELDDFDTVYSAHFARYGAIPATLQHAPGTTVTLSVTWLTDAQLGVMHASERENYFFCLLDGIELAPEFGPAPERAFAYVSRWGCWQPDGAPLALEAARAAGRRWRALDQKAVLAAARDRIAGGETLEAFVDAHIEDAALRQRRAAVLRETVQAFAYPRVTEVETE